LRLKKLFQRIAWDRPLKSTLAALDTKKGVNQNGQPLDVVGGSGKIRTFGQLNESQKI